MIIKRRKIYRMGMGFFFILVAYLGGNLWAIGVLGFFLALLLLLEYQRHLHPGFYGWLAAHSFGIFKEHPGLLLPDTYFVLSAFLVFTIFPPNIALASLLFLTFGDALSTLVGVNWGRHIVYRKKSLEGTTAFFLSTLLFALVISRMPRYPLSLPVGITGGLVASLTELFSVPPDDNFSVTILSGISMWIVANFLI